MGSIVTIAEKKAVSELCGWYGRMARVLPWRQTQDPYSIWVSEIMLQQTQVVTVIPYYERFLARFPNLKALAKAPEQDVLHLWSGLGYYSRARNLQKGARYIRENHNGHFPREREQALAVPGVGPYTAGAVLSIAYDLAVPLVDGNVQRVFSRYFALKDSLETKAASQFFWRKAAEWVGAAESPRVFNQALMELGATVCSKANPRCGLCPLKSGCQAFALQTPEAFPVRAPRRKAVKLWWAPLVHERRGKLWLIQNPQKSWWSGLWDFPRVEAPTSRKLPAAIEAATQGATGELLDTHTHTVTHHRIHVAPVVLRWRNNGAPKTAG
ncbi:A/G-specific adenine glycosylase, partial [bacterium]|nr:A/G-specific adenine glycosylase [bacterium]